MDPPACDSFALWLVFKGSEADEAGHQHPERDASTWVRRIYTGHHRQLRICSPVVRRCLGARTSVDGIEVALPGGGGGVRERRAHRPPPHGTAAASREAQHGLVVAHQPRRRPQSVHRRVLSCDCSVFIVSDKM